MNIINAAPLRVLVLTLVFAFFSGLADLSVVAAEAIDDAQEAVTETAETLNQRFQESRLVNRSFDQILAWVFIGIHTVAATILRFLSPQVPTVIDDDGTLIWSFPTAANAFHPSHIAIADTDGDGEGEYRDPGPSIILYPPRRRVSESRIEFSSVPLEGSGRPPNGPSPPRTVAMIVGVTSTRRPPSAATFRVSAA